MEQSGPEYSSQQITLSCDDDICEYIRGESRGEPLNIESTPILEYARQRDFGVEPLEPETAAYLINVLLEDTSSKTIGEHAISCWAPIENKRLTSLRERLDQWGYTITDVTRTNRSIQMTPLIELTARQSPSPLDQLRAIGTIAPDAGALLDGWAVVVQNRHRRPHEEIDTADWAEIRGVGLEVVEDNVLEMGEALRDYGGIPGTQWAIQEDGGVSVSRD